PTSPTADPGGSVPPRSGSLRRSSIVSESETPVPASSPDTPPSEPTAERATAQEPTAEQAPQEEPAPTAEAAAASSSPTAAPAAEETPVTAAAPGPRPGTPGPRPGTPGPRPGAPTPAALAAKKPTAALLPVAPPVTEYDPEQLAAAAEYGTVGEDGTVTV